MEYRLCDRSLKNERGPNFETEESSATHNGQAKQNAAKV